MKVIQAPSRKDGKEHCCSGKGNGGSGCGAILLVDPEDVFSTTSQCRDETFTHATFECPICHRWTDTDCVPAGNPGKPCYTCKRIACECADREANREQRQDMSRAIELIRSERIRQVESEGRTREGDDGYVRDELADAAACYAFGASRKLQGKVDPEPPEAWPWPPEWWKPGDWMDPKARERDLVKAGALIVAELERRARLRRRGDEQVDPFTKNLDKVDTGE